VCIACVKCKRHKQTTNTKNHNKNLTLTLALRCLMTTLGSTSSLIESWFLMRATRCAKRAVLMLSSMCKFSTESVATIAVCAVQQCSAVHSAHWIAHCTLHCIAHCTLHCKPHHTTPQRRSIANHSTVHPSHTTQQNTYQISDSI